MSEADRCPRACTFRHAGRIAAVFLILSLWEPPGACAGQQPLWEFGLGAGVLIFNDYRGADTTHAYPVPLPYFIYRGKLFESDREGLRGKLFHQDRVELNLSVNGTTPVRNNSARSGMPDLRPTLEIGPSLNTRLWRSADRRLQLDLRLPARAAFTIEARPGGIGWYYAPHLNLDIAQYAGPEGWKLGLLAGPLFAQHRYDNYFYGVAPQYAVPGRPAYEAPGGYAGTQTLVSLTRRFPGYWFGAYLRHDSLAGASFAASPLVSRSSYWSGGLGFAWMLGRSQRMVESPD
ncbi:MAG TPA: MipA/OmpV family protein [Steroidobacteraceae bacterium]|nr:MipA/OmpV family protein [Steroidobacteraceae bacterium]